MSNEIPRGIPVGNLIQLMPVKDPMQRLFKIGTIQAFVECVSVLAGLVRQRKRTHVEIVSEDRFKLAEIRAAYFCWLREKAGAADSDGASIDELHRRHKATYLLPLLCRENQEFADLVYRETVDGVTSPIVIRLLSVADSSVTTPAIMREYFEACQQGGIRDGY